MITFAFVVLSLVLFGAALYFAFRYIELTQESASTSLRAEVLAALNEQRQIVELYADKTNAQSERIDELTVTIQNLPKPDGSKTVAVPGPKDNFSKMEDRYAEQFKKTVIVDGVEQPTAEA